jgi:plasmid replication initiation protein
MENKKGGDLICRRPETIIEARFNLTRRQNDILDMVFASIENDDKLKYQIDISKYSKLYNLKDKTNIYGSLKKTVKTFENKGFSITQKIDGKNEKRIYFSWFSSIEYIDKKEKIEIELGQKLKTLMLSAKKACFYQLKYSLNFHNIYSKRLYYYLKSYENSNKDGTGWRVDNLNELRAKLECPKSYDVYYEFKRFVLNPAYEEINGDSDISFEYEETKIKSKVTSLKFRIKTNKIKEPVITIPTAYEEVSATSEENEEENLIEKVKNIIKNTTNIQMNNKSADEIYKSAIKHEERGNVPLELVREVAEYSKTQDIKKGFVGWFKTTVKNYQKPVQSLKKDSFTNYDQRNYDFDDLEKNY